MFSFLFLGQYGVMDYEEAIERGLARNPSDFYNTMDMVNLELAKNEADRDNSLLAKGLVSLAELLSSSAYGLGGLVANDEVMSVATKIFKGDEEIYTLNDTTANSLLTAVDTITEEFGIKSMLCNITLRNLVKNATMSFYLRGLIDTCDLAENEEVKGITSGYFENNIMDVIKPVLVVYPQLQSIRIENEIEHIAVSNYETEDFEEEEVNGI